MATTITAPAAQQVATGRVARITAATARVLMGLLFTMTGLNGFVNFLPADISAIPADAMAFNAALYETGYMLPLTFGVQLIAGILLVAKRYVPFALTLLAPVIVNIFLFHVFLEPAGTALAVVVSALEIYLAWTYRAAFRSVLRAR